MRRRLALFLAIALCGCTRAIELVNPCCRVFPHVLAAFGSQRPVSAELIHAVPLDACAPISGNATGKVVLAVRGECAFAVKAVNAEAAGAVALIVANSKPTGPGFPELVKMGGGDGMDLSIPSVFVAHESGEQLLAAIEDASPGPVIVSVNATGAVDLERQAQFDLTVFLTTTFRALLLMTAVGYGTYALALAIVLARHRWRAGARDRAVRALPRTTFQPSPEPALGRVDGGDRDRMTGCNGNALHRQEDALPRARQQSAGTTATTGTGGPEAGVHARGAMGGVIRAASSTAARWAGRRPRGGTPYSPAPTEDEAAEGDGPRGDDCGVPTPVDASEAAAGEQDEETGGGEGSSDAEMCVICISPYEGGDGLVSLPCGHQFHADCVEPWFARSTLCPLCKRTVVPSASGTTLPATSRAILLRHLTCALTMVGTASVMYFLL